MVCRLHGQGDQAHSPACGEEGGEVDEKAPSRQSDTILDVGARIHQGRRESEDPGTNGEIRNREGTWWRLVHGKHAPEDDI